MEKWSPVEHCHLPKSPEKHPVLIFGSSIYNISSCLQPLKRMKDGIWQRERKHNSGLRDLNWVWVCWVYLGLLLFFWFSIWDKKLGKL